MAFGHICFSPSKAKGASVTSASNIQAENTNLKCDTGNTEDRLCDRVQLKDVNVLPNSLYERTDLCKYSTVFDTRSHSTLHRSTHQRGVFLQQSFEFLECQPQRFRLSEQH